MLSPGWTIGWTPALNLQPSECHMRLQVASYTLKHCKNFVVIQVFLLGAGEMARRVREWATLEEDLSLSLPRSSGHSQPPKVWL